MEIDIRSAKLSDLDRLLELEQEVIASERPFNAGIKDEKVTYYDLKKLIVADDVYLSVAESSSKIIASGYAMLKKSKTYDKSNYFSYLGFMYVEPTYRGQGVNKKIIESLVTWSKSKGVTEVFLEVFDQNTTAVKAYEKSGFAKTLVTMRMDVS